MLFLYVGLTTQKLNALLHDTSATNPHNARVEHNKGVPQTKSDQSPSEILPYEEPQHIDRDEISNHRINAEGIEKDETCQNQGAKADGAPHVYVAATLADGHLAIESKQRPYGSINAEHTQ